MVQPEVEEIERCIICGAPTFDFVCEDCEYWHYGRRDEEEEDVGEGESDDAD